MRCAWKSIDSSGWQGISSCAVGGGSFERGRKRVGRGRVHRAGEALPKALSPIALPYCKRPCFGDAGHTYDAAGQRIYVQYYKVVAVLHSL